jgi:lysophospholipase L1-like esterase
VVERNQLASRIMVNYGVKIDDLFEAITPQLSTLQNPNDVHFNAAGHDFLGQTVAAALEAALK